MQKQYPNISIGKNLQHLFLLYHQSCTESLREIPERVPQSHHSKHKLEKKNPSPVMQSLHNFHWLRFLRNILNTFGFSFLFKNIQIPKQQLFVYCQAFLFSLKGYVQNYKKICLFVCVRKKMSKSSYADVSI